MKNYSLLIFNSLFSVILGLIPWGNVLIVLGNALQKGDTKKAIAPFLFLLAEAFLMYIIVADELSKNSFCSILLMMVLIAAAIYSIIYFFKNEDVIKLKSLILIFLISFFSSWIILVNIIGAYILRKTDEKLAKKWGWMQALAILITMYILYSSFSFQKGSMNISYTSILTLFLVNTCVTVLSLSLTGRFGIAPNNEVCNNIDPKELKIKNTIAFFFDNLLIAIFCIVPWVSLFYLFNYSIKKWQKIGIIVSLGLIICESYLIFNILKTAPFDINTLYSFVVVSIISSIFTFVFIIDDENKKTEKSTEENKGEISIFVFIICTIVGILVIWLVAQTRYAYYPIGIILCLTTLKDKKYTKAILYTSMILVYYYLYSIGCTQYHFVLAPIYATGLIHIIDALDTYGILSAFESRLKLLIKQLLNQNVTTVPEMPLPEIIPAENLEPETVTEETKPTPKPQPKPYDKGWTVDDTKQIDVRLATIEDAISPLTIKNEYEKSAKDLILYIRKLEKHNDADIKNTLGNEGLSSYLEKFFSKMKFDTVRWVYIRSLSVVIENYSKRDNRVLPYLQKLLSIEKEQA